MTSAPCTETKLRRPGIAAFDFLHDQAVLHVAHARAAVTVQVGSEEAEFADFGNQFAWKAGVAKAIADQRQNAFIDEPPGGLSNEKFLGGELRIDEQVVHTAKGHDWIQSNGCTG